MAPLRDNPGWQSNAVGLWFNSRFGFGLMNAYGLVKEAANWTTVPPRRTCSNFAIKRFNNKTLSYKNQVEISIKTDGCKGTENEINFLEHVELRVNIIYSNRGSLEVFLVSPSGA